MNKLTLIATLTLSLLMAPSCNNPEYKYGDCVVVTEGFYRELPGYIQAFYEEQSIYLIYSPDLNQSFFIPSKFLGRSAITEGVDACGTHYE